MARESNHSRDSLTEFFHAGWRSKAVRTALVAAILAAGSLIGRAAYWAINDPWKGDFGAIKTVADRAHDTAVATDTRLQLSELSLWRELVRVEAVINCPKGKDPGACVSVANDGFDFMLHDANVRPMRTPEQAAAAVLQQIHTGSLLR